VMAAVVMAGSAVASAGALRQSKKKECGSLIVVGPVGPSPTSRPLVARPVGLFDDGLRHSLKSEANHHRRQAHLVAFPAA